MSVIKITCPNCDASFKVKAEILQPAGRKVKCARCANKWHQDPIEAEEKPAAKPAPKKRKKKKKPEDDGEAKPPPRRKRVKKKTAPPPPPPPEPDDEPEDDPDDDGYDEVAGYDAVAASVAEAGAQSAPSADDMAPIPPLMEKPPKKSKLTTKNAIMALWGVFGLLVVGSVVMFFVMADTLKDQFPDLDGIYQTFGLSPSEGGKRLQVKNIATDIVFDRDKRVNVLEVKADIVNPNADRMKEIPPVLIILKNADGTRVSSQTHRLPNPSIGKAAVVEMTARIENPHREARRVEIQFQPDLPNDPGQ